MTAFLEKLMENGKLTRCEDKEQLIRLQRLVSVFAENGREEYLLEFSAREEQTRQLLRKYVYY